MARKSEPSKQSQENPVAAPTPPAAAGVDAALVEAVAKLTSHVDALANMIKDLATRVASVERQQLNAPRQHRTTANFPEGDIEWTLVPWETLQEYISTAVTRLTSHSDYRDNVKAVDAWLTPSNGRTMQIDPAKGIWHEREPVRGTYHARIMVLKQKEREPGVTRRQEAERPAVATYYMTVTS
jgi:hypothetical protein